jgi:hypothetical protein
MTWIEPRVGRDGQVWTVAILLVALLAPSAAAQSLGNQPARLAPSQAPLSSQAPGPGSPGASLVPGSGFIPSAQSPIAVPPTPTQAVPMVPAGHVALTVAARYGREAPPITGGLIWRVYPDKPDASGAFRLIKEERSSAPVFVLPAGGYVVHVSFGLASASKAVRLRSETVRETFEISAGGVRIEGKVGDARIPPGQISFDLYKGSQFESGERRPTATNVVTGDVVLVPEGVYYVVSNYGDGNAVVRSDIRIQAGKLTDVTVNHRAAVITLKLVGERGGEALANTAWTVLTPGGDVIKESIGAFPRVVLAEGDYRAIARNENRSYEREFKVITGVDGEIEVLAR